MKDKLIDAICFFGWLIAIISVIVVFFHISVDFLLGK